MEEGETASGFSILYGPFDPALMIYCTRFTERLPLWKSRIRRSTYQPESLAQPYLGPVSCCLISLGKVGDLLECADLSALWSPATCRQHRRDGQKGWQVTALQKHSITIPRLRLILSWCSNEALKDHTWWALPQFSSKSASDRPVLFLGHFTPRDDSSYTNRRAAGPDFHLLRKDCFAPSRANKFFGTARCRRHFQAEPRQTFANVQWTDARRSRRAGSNGKRATSNHWPVGFVPLIPLVETWWPSAARIRL